MKKKPCILLLILIGYHAFSILSCQAQPEIQVSPGKSVPVISSLAYDNITQTSVTVTWTTDLPADSKIQWMKADSNYQPLIFTDSSHIAGLETNHAVQVNNLLPATIYKYRVLSQNGGGTAADSGYFITQSTSSGNTEVYFNHTVDTTVSTGEYANGSQDFEALLLNRINNAGYSIDITLWQFTNYSSIASALIQAKNKGVKIRFITTANVPNSPQVDSLAFHGIPVLIRNFDTTHSMHNKFWIFDYRGNSDPSSMYLWTGSTNVTHPQFHSDRNNIIVIQDQSLCAVYTREFEEMWGSHGDMYVASRAKFGAEKADNVPHILNVAGTRMEVYFAPSDSVGAFLDNLFTTKPVKSLYFCMLKFSYSPVEDALHAIFNEGRQVRGVFDLSNSTISNCAYPRMKGMAVPNAWSPPARVFLDTIDGLIHHKYCIIDPDSSGGNQIMVTGSFNWEPDAELVNDENSLTIFSPRITNLYFQEFYARYRESGGEDFGAQGIPGKNPADFLLAQNVPNPFNQATRIRYDLPRPGFTRLAVFDLFGREAALLVNEWQSQGSHEVSCDGTGFPAGVYYYSLTVNGYNAAKKMVVIK